MIKRIFQDCAGHITAFAGARFSRVKGLINSADNSIVVLWLYNNNTDSWYRMFNDGTYCGIDQYPTDQSSRDLDDDIVVVDYSNWFAGKTMLRAAVFSEISEENNLHVVLKFNASECRLVYHGAEAVCSIRYVDLSG